jgi:polyhydroxyalkanoate synthesis repressor PhaR
MEKLTLKKYANRRLYDTEKSAYVTLDDIALAIRNGREVEIIDAKTSEDVTAFILTQIVLEEARKKNFLFPVPFLHMIIQYGDSVMGEFFEKYFQQVLQTYLSYKTLADNQFLKWLEMGAELSTMSPEVFGNMNPLQALFEKNRKMP